MRCIKAVIQASGSNCWTSKEENLLKGVAMEFIIVNLDYITNNCWDHTRAQGDVLLIDQYHLNMSSLQFNKIYGPVISTYPALLRHLYNINTLISDHIPAPNNFSKANTQKLYDAIGRPLDRIPSVLVGGTNGKGSTCLKISNGLRSSGIKTGLFVSPHISSFRERVQVNGDLIEESDVLTFVPKVLELCLTQEIPATFFEITFALACLQFESQACDAVVLEVGVGGEWDATNVVYSALSIICSVDLDHTRFLGPTVEAIAANKAGIFKPLRPAIHGPGCPRDVLLDAAIKRNSLLFDISEAIGFNLPGEISPVAPVLSVDDEKYTDALNTRLAHAGLTLLKAASIGALTEGALGRQGMVPGDVDLYRCFSSLELRSEHLLRALSITAPCRWEKVRVTVPVEDGKTDVDVILDLGHNPAAINALMRRAKKEFFGKRVR